MNSHSPARQIIGLNFAPSWLNDPDLAIPALTAARDGGFGTVIGFVRHLHHTISHEHVRQAITQTASNCHRLGLRFVLDADWAHWAGEFVELYPEMAQWVTVRGEGPCLGGCFELDLPYPGLPMEEVAEISAIFGIAADGAATWLDPASVACERRSYNSQYPLPSYDDDHVYDYYRPGLGGHYTLGLAGQIDMRFVRIVFFVSFQGVHYPDVAHPRYLEVQRQVLEAYAAAGLDGVGWDEPGKGGSFKGWKSGAGFYAFFQQRHGYDLRQKLLDLEQGESAAAVKTRRDYHDTLVEMNYCAQQEFNRHAQALFGEGIFRGTHHTFAGLSMDIRCGCADYFRLGEVLSHAFTDTGWEQGPFAETTYNFVLAESLRKELGKPGAYCNDWSRTPRVKWYDYFTRLKSLYQVDWFAIFIGRANERHSLFPDDPYWADVARNAQGLNRLAEWLGDGVDTVSDTAVWYGWECLISFSKRHAYLIRLAQTCHVNLAQAALESGRFYDYVSDRALSEARIAEGRLVINGRTYRRLILPYAVIVRPEVWDVVRRAAAAAIPVVFIGPPPWMTTAGQPLADEFAALAGIAPVSFTDYHAWFAGHKPIPTDDQWEPLKIDFSFPATLLAGTRAERNAEEELIAVTNPLTGAAWLTGVDPGPLAAPFLGAPPQDGLPLVHQGRAHLRVLCERQSGEHVLLLAAPMGERLNEVVRLGDASITIAEGSWAALRLRLGKMEEPVTLG